MKAKTRLRFLHLVCLLLGLLSLTPNLWAQNENETVGFQSNHLFESGQFGENIDILNGGLNLTIPIGPKYQVSQYLGYQLLLTYGSKVWDTTRPNFAATIHRLGHAGLGFNLHFGRIYRDVEQVENETQCTWYYVSPDGAEHEIPVASGQGPCWDGPMWFTIDNTHYEIGGTVSRVGWDGNPTTRPILSVKTPDGTLYTMSHFIQAYSGPTGPLNSARPVGGDPAGLATSYNRDFGGWYVTQITNVRSGSANTIDITYDGRPGFEHLISSIRDSTGRTISFTNECVAGAESQCSESFALPYACPAPADEPPTACNAQNRASTRIAAITVPAFKGSTAFDNTVNATYNFDYSFAAVQNVGAGGTVGPVNLLRRIVYPRFKNHAHPGGIPEEQRYAMSFDYSTYGEIFTRTLPTGAAVTYTWSSYTYVPAMPTAQPYRQGPAAFTRCITRKTLTEGGRMSEWTYTREAELSGTIFTNPKYVTTKDPLGNETVYSYRASRPFSHPPSSGYTDPPSRDTEDGYAPEWNDGVNYLIEYYQGNGSSRKLVRTETRDYDADLWGTGDHRDKKNVRMNRAVTIHNDDGGRRSTVAYRDWDGKGHYRVVVESGDGVEGTRTIRTEYFSSDPDQFHYREVSEGRRVLSRSDYSYDDRRRLILSIERTTLPATIGTARNLVAQVGDIKTMYEYDFNGNLFLKIITDQGPGTLVNPPMMYQMRYTWQAGGYLATKEFASDPVLGQYYSWRAIDRSRDGNTGLIYLSRDSAGVQAGYKYDALGRLTDIVPRSTAELLPASTEFSTEIEYVDIRHTTVRQGSPTSMGSDFSCANAPGNYIMTCYEYDELGRLARTEKRSDNPGVWTAYQKTFYDALGRTVFQSEWIRRDAGQTYCARPDPANPPPNPCSGTTLDYSEPANPAQFDPFGRVRRVRTADGKETFTDYFGNNSRVKVAGIQGVGASGQACSYDAMTTYFRDGWGRLVYVQAPVATCGGATVNGGADAAYTYDLRDNLIHVEMADDTSLPISRQTRSFEYDSLNRLHSSYNPESGTQIVTGYDALGNVTETEDAARNRLFSVYDQAGRLLEVRRQDNQKPEDPITPPVLTLLRNTYDQGNPSVDCAGGVPNPASAFGCSNGRLTTTRNYDDAEALAHTREITYAGLNGRLSREKNLYSGWPGTASAPVDLQYNDFGLVSRITYPQGLAGGIGAFAVTNTYANGYATEVWDPTQGQAQAKGTYNAAGGYQEVTTPGSAKTTIQADARNRPSKITIGKGTYNPATDTYSGGTYYKSGVYQYDGAGNIFGIGSNQYHYDAAGRLVKAVDVYEGVTRKQTYIYDEFGNMTQKDQNDVADSLQSRDLFTVKDQTTGLNRNRILDHQSGSSTPNLFTYDARGNLRQGDAQTYEVDARNRMVALRNFASSQGTEVARYAYDGAANRLRKEDLDRGITTFYVRDAQGRLLSEFRRTNRGTYTPEWAKHYIYLGDRLVGLRENLNPGPPGPLKAETSSAVNTVKLTWKAAPQGEGVTVSSYKVSRSPNTTPPTWTVLGNTQSTTYTDTPATGYVYRYVVGTMDSQGRESFGQDEIVVLAGDPTPPGTPSGLAGVAGDRRADLSWTANPPEEYVVGYHVYRRVGGGSAERITAVPVAGTSFADQGLQNGLTHWYALTAVDSASLESTSRTAEVQVTPGDYTPPGAPLRILASAGCGAASSVTVSWEPNPITDDVSGYRLFREPMWPGPTEFQTVAANTYTDSGTQAGTPYVYWVKALDSSGNVSESSLRGLVRTRNAAAAVPVPAMPYAQSGDGRVTLRIRIPLQGMYSSISAVTVYRKLNIETSCDGFERVGEINHSFPGRCTTGLSCPCPAGQFCFDNVSCAMSAGTCSTNADCAAGQSCIYYWGPSGYVDFPDGTAPNNVAYDYAVTYVDGTAQESALSATALGIPVARPIHYSECVEELPSLNYDGAIDCCPDCSPPTHAHPYRRVQVRWSQPEARAYQPFSDHGDGTLGYLKGYRVYRHLLNSTLGNEDKSSLTALNADYDKRYCRFNPDVVCQAGGFINFNCATLGRFCNFTGEACSSSCLAGAGSCVDDYCRERPDGAVHDGYGQCSGDGRNCMVDSDCASGTCQSAPFDPSLLLYEDGGLNTGYRRDSYNDDCLAAKAVYKVFANGTWLTVESDFSENFNVAEKADRINRCIHMTLDACANLNPAATFPVPACPPASSIPPPPPAPTVQALAPGEIQVSWGPAPPLGQCQLLNPDFCSDFGVACINPGEFCSEADGNKCRLRSPAACDPNVVPTSCPTGQDCVPNTAGDIGGWKLYVVEPNTGNSGETGQSPARYHYLRPAAALTFEANTRSHTFTGLSDLVRGGMPNLLKFRVAVVDTLGRLSAVSPPSAQIEPNPSPSPASVKAVVWTVNDAIRNYLPSGSFPNPRELDGIKISWRYSSGTLGGGSGFRVWRRSDPSGKYCALLKPGTAGSPNPPGIEVCTNEVDGSVGDPRAYSHEFTTGPGGGNVVYVDKTVRQNVTYYYTVTTNDSARSQETRGISLGHLSQPLSPPAYFKAVAPDGRNEWYGIYLKWCPNAAHEGVTSYKVYRSEGPNGSKGPYTLLATIPPACLDAGKRCEIGTVGVEPTPTPGCTPGIEGTCEIVDLTVRQTDDPSLTNQVANFIYYYVVTAVRTTGATTLESAYSVENSGWPNYCAPSCYSKRYDHDNFPDFRCGDEEASLRHDLPALAETNTSHEEGVYTGAATGRSPVDLEAGVTASYRAIGQIICDDCGGGGGEPPPPPTFRFVYFHLDHLGSPRVMTDASGIVVSKHHYMPFGEEAPVQVMNSSSKRHFTGHERDQESGLDYMLARYYSSSLDRFLSVDPSRRSVSAANPQTWNRYSYARNNPLARIDPDGLTDIYIGGASDARSQIVAAYANQHPSASGRTVAYFAHNQVKQATAFANASLKNGEPLNIIGHSWGAASALKVAAGVNGRVDTLVGVDPVGKPFTFGTAMRPENVANLVTVNAQPTSPNLSDSAASLGRRLLCGGIPDAFTSQADVTINVDANHEDFEALYTTDGSNGPSASQVVDHTYQKKSGGKGTFFSSGSQPSRSSEGYVDEDGTHWTIQGADVR